MDFLVSRVERPDAVILLPKGEIGKDGPELLGDAIVYALAVAKPVVLDLRHARYTAPGQISAAIENARLDQLCAGRTFDPVVVVSADPGLRRFLEDSLPRFVRVRESWTVPPVERPKAPRPSPAPSVHGRVIDREEYLSVFEQWFRLLDDHEIYRSDARGLRQWWSWVDPDALPVRAPVEEFCRRMPELPGRLQLTVRKSNLLYRMLYRGEPVRHRRCPGTETSPGSGIRGHSPFDCPCGGCGWLL